MFRVFLASKEFVSIVTEKEKWFGTQYKQDYLPDELIRKCETCEIISELHLPRPNEFIPTDFQLFSKEKTFPRPQLPIKIKVIHSSNFNLKNSSFYSRKMNFIGFIMEKIHSINYRKRIFILNFESKMS